MEKNMEKELSISQMETVMKVIGKKVIKMGRELSSAKKGHKYNQESGRKGSSLVRKRAYFDVQVS